MSATFSVRTFIRLVCAVTAVVIGASMVLGMPAQASAAAPGATFGLLGPTAGQLDTIASSNISRVSLASGWDQVEPRRNVLDTAELAQLRDRIDDLRTDGKQVVLDLGLQYPPSWVFDLPGDTRFVDQYGEQWHGNLSQDVPNAVYNSRVRSAEATYIARLADALGPDNVSAVRIGGLLSGELRYPPNVYGGHTDAMWGFDSAALAAAPHPDWRPGAGSATDIRESLTYYFASLTRYESWMMRTVAGSFPGAEQQVMLPGWGLRPGMVDDAVAAGLRNTTNAEVNGMIAAGLDWDSQVRDIKSADLNGTVYTTWLDAPTQANTPQGQAPVDYLAALATKYRLPIAGENSGGGGGAALQLCLDRVRADHLTGMMYMSGDLVAAGVAGVSIDDLTAAAAQLNP